MKLSSYCAVATFLLAGFLTATSLADDIDLASRAGLPLAQTASRGIVTRDPSTIVKCKDEFWVFYTGRGIPSFHSKDLVKWEPGPPVFRTALAMPCRSALQASFAGCFESLWAKHISL